MSLADQLLGSLAALAVTGGLGAGLLFLHGRRVRRSGGAVGRIRRALKVVLPAVYLVALFALAGAGWLDAVDAATAGLPDLIGDLLGLALGLGAPALAVVVAYLGAFPAIRAVRDVEVGVGTVVVRFLRYLLGMAAIAAVALVAIGRLPLRGVAATAVAAAGVVAGLLALAPWLIRLLQSTRAPTDAERERLDRLLDEAGVDPAGVRVLESGDGSVGAVLRGVPGRRHLFVYDGLIEADDETVRGLLALQGARARRFHTEVRALLAVGTIWWVLGAALGVVSVPGVPALAVASVGLVVGAAGLYLGGRLVFRGDEAAAERVGRAAVRAALQTYADANDAPLEWGLRRRITAMEPPLADRLDRLREA